MRMLVGGIRPRAMRLLLVAIGVYDALYLGIWLARSDSPRFGDFFGLWTFGVFALAEPAAVLYDPEALQRFQQVLDPAFTGAYPFFYPPSFLLLTVPLALLPLGYAWLGWCTGTLALYVTAVLGRGWRSRAGAALLVAPTTLLCIVAGQSGLLTGAMMLGGLRALPARPWLGGALLGLLTVKPQLGLLLLIALVAARQWRAIAAACLTAVGVAVATGIAFGWHIWIVWAQTIPLGMKMVLNKRAEIIDLMPTVTAGLFQLGMPEGPTRLIQLATAIAVCCVTWRAFRPGISPNAIAVLAMATFLATPYGFVYDLPMVTGALVLTMLARQPALAETVLFGLIAVVPLLMLGTGLPLAEPILLGTGIALLARRIGKDLAEAHPAGIYRAA
jgi:Glycosyltransferase family 87